MLLTNLLLLAALIITLCQLTSASNQGSPVSDPLFATSQNEEDLQQSQQQKQQQRVKKSSYNNYDWRPISSDRYGSDPQEYDSPTELFGKTKQFKTATPEQQDVIDTLENAYRLRMSGLMEEKRESKAAEKLDNKENNVGEHQINARSRSKSPEPLNSLFDTIDADAADEEEELNLDLPYGIQNVRKRVVRANPTLDHRSKSTTYQSLCPTKRISIPLETSGYEYRPSHYIEVTCAHIYTPTRNYDFNKNKICSEAGFSCIQLNRTIHLIRRNKASTIECWESEIRIVPSGCECMWPKHNYGDIVTYHDTQKRFTPNANVQPNADYNAGSGYLQIPRQVEVIDISGQRHSPNGGGVGFEAYDLN